jgi:hypothetical protein
VTEWPLLDRDTTVEAVAASMELINQGKTAHALILLDELLHRLMIDEAMEFRVEVAKQFGESAARQ